MGINNIGGTEHSCKAIKKIRFGVMNRYENVMKKELINDQ